MYEVLVVYSNWVQKSQRKVALVRLGSKLQTVYNIPPVPSFSCKGLYDLLVTYIHEVRNRTNSLTGINDSHASLMKRKIFERYFGKYQMENLQKLVYNVFTLDVHTVVSFYIYMNTLSVNDMFIHWQG